MDFAVSDEMQELLQRFRDFVELELFPLEPEFLTRGFGAMIDVLEEKRARVRELGLALPQIDKEHGGLGLTVLEHGLVSAELGKSPVGNYVFSLCTARMSRRSVSSDLCSRARSGAVSA